MNSLYLELELLSPVAITARSATVGGHESLTWIPGGQLLGATAAALLRSQDAALPDEIWRILLSGEVSFGDAWPEIDGQPAPCAPLSLHRPKGAEDPIYNLVIAKRAGKGQLEQVRDLHISGNRHVVQPRRGHTLRTAIGEHGRAREGFLFGIEALDAGQRFLARIDATDPDLLKRVRSCLDGREITVGRSRSAEFGHVAVRVREPWPEPERGEIGERLVLWAISDLALRDLRSGAPRLQLTPADLGLSDDWEVLWEQSFVRTRRYSPFNGKRLRPDLERQVLRPGSVLVLEGPGLDPDEARRLRERLRAGIGEHVQEGFGRIAVNPLLLAGGDLELTRPQPMRPSGEGPMPDDVLGRWLRDRRTALNRGLGAEHHAREMVQSMQRWKIKPSQWGEIRRLAREARFRSGGEGWLRAQIESFLSHGARLHVWPREARETLIEKVRAATPDIVERASTMLARQQEARP